MHELFQNLIGNAIKFQREDSKPCVKITSVLAPNERVEISVEDNGIGFEEQYLDRIFKPFERLHRREEYKGSGIGLAICKKIVEHHGGEIRARSLVGNGSTFIVSLPLR